MRKGNSRQGDIVAARESQKERVSLKPRSPGLFVLLTVETTKHDLGVPRKGPGHFTPFFSFLAVFLRPHERIIELHPEKVFLSASSPPGTPTIADCWGPKRFSSLSRKWPPGFYDHAPMPPFFLCRTKITPTNFFGQTALEKPSRTLSLEFPQNRTEIVFF